MKNKQMKSQSTKEKVKLIEFSYSGKSMFMEALAGCQKDFCDAVGISRKDLGLKAN